MYIVSNLSQTFRFYRVTLESIPATWKPVRVKIVKNRHGFGACEVKQKLGASTIDRAKFHRHRIEYPGAGFQGHVKRAAGFVRPVSKLKQRARSKPDSEAD
ncbi:intraflagellar transport protein 88 homolog [Striga asiatica]|uniref:Intraflagellar transport protein 88 homolog n=1 Tax=Striga asiatica TaxID=4170 RepID=A0A5A7P3C8_STRAF|nr:intraflagellar transport protein 88 homolog [Striga asiatica]